jgi:uncharacterized protein
MRVWIDLSNSPHPLLFAPVARRLEHLGATIAVTARDNAQTVELAQERWRNLNVVGAESPPGRVRKAGGMLARAASLARWARWARPTVALSHNSYAQLVVARALGIPSVTAMDFEHQPANHLAFRAAGRILLPEVLPSAAVRRQGAAVRKVIRYPGLKEELYLGDFSPDRAVCSGLGLERRDGAALVVARTPPSGAVYHRFDNPLFAACLRRLAAQPHVRCVVLVRQENQRAGLEALELGNLTIPRAAVDARSLLFYADLMVGAGGTMTREAALMGIPTYSLFAGARPAVDRWLEQRGDLRRLHDPEQLRVVRPRDGGPVSLEMIRKRGRRIEEVFVEATAAAARRSQW